MTAREPRGAPRLAYLCLQATREGQASHAHVREIIRGLERRGWLVDLVQPRYADAGTPIPGIMGRLVEFARVQREYVRVARNADVLYIRSHFAALPVAIWARFGQRPVVQEVNGVYDDASVAWPQLRPLQWLVTASQRGQLRWADLVITVTDGLAQWLRDDANLDAVAVVPNGANVDVFTPEGRRRPGLPDRYVGFVGALAPWQGVDVMLDATRDPRWPDDVPLVIVGSGAKADTVRAAAAGNRSIVQLGTEPYAEIPAFIRGASVMLSVKGSVDGTFAGGTNPLKVFEALACGVPVIVSDYPGQADLVRRERCGWVIPPNDPTALARAVAEAMASPQDRKERGARGRGAIVRGHSWDQRAGATDALLRRLVQGTTP